MFLYALLKLNSYTGCYCYLNDRYVVANDSTSAKKFYSDFYHLTADDWESERYKVRILMYPDLYIKYEPGSIVTVLRKTSDTKRR